MAQMMSGYSFPKSRGSKTTLILFSLFLLAGGLPLVVAQEPTEIEKEAATEKPKAALSPEQEKARQMYLSIPWQKGPGTADLGSVAEIKLPEGFQFTGREGGRTFEELNQNPSSPGLLGIITPVGSLDWFIVFDYDETGYVSDDEKDKIDANAILNVIRQGSEQGNELRRSKGWDEIRNIRWEIPPSYDPASHNLVWATTFEVVNDRTVNYSTRILGRKGVINANLVGNPERIPQIVPVVKSLLSGLEYKAGLRYAEFRTGDRVAAYGLTALITGGAAVVAVKTGLFAKLGILLAKSGKVIVGGIVGLFALLSRFRKKTA